MRGTFRVLERVYGPPDQFGYRQMLHAAGSHIPWAQAVAEGLVSGDALPAEEVPFTVPHNVYDDGPDGRRLIHREGTMISLADAVRLGLVAPPADAAEVDVAGVGAMVGPQVGKRVRTTKVSNPET